LPDYSGDRELLMDILKYGPDVKVNVPPELRETAENLLEMSVSQYQQGKTTGSGSGPDSA
jgi:predicted DNA-binding transcriptional regulator YafY